MRRTDGPWPVYEIIPGKLYQRGKLHRFSAEVKRAGVEYYGITHAVALAPTTADPNLGDVIHYQHYPIPDGLLREAQKLVSMAADCADVINNGGCVMTMCNAGRNRSGLLSALTVCEMIGVPGSAAMKLVREHRPNALANPHFEAFLEALR